MKQEHEHNQGGCCGGGEKLKDQGLPKKDDKGCCHDDGDKKPETNKTEAKPQRGGCCS